MVDRNALKDAMRSLEPGNVRTLRHAFLRHRRQDRGYYGRRTVAITQALADPMLMAQFRAGAPRPRGYGVGLDERLIEYPWLLSRLPDRAALLLDAGSTLNFRYILDRPEWAPYHLHIATLAPETNCFWSRGISYLYADLRHLPLRDGLYDAIVCVSVIEHVGLDNRRMTHDERTQEDRPASSRKRSSSCAAS